MPKLYDRMINQNVTSPYRANMEFKKPKRLVEGDTVAVLSPSWGGPSLYPGIFDMGLRELESLGLRVKEFPTTRMDAEALRANPRVRADDVSNVFSDTEVNAIIPSIGGDDSVRILDYLDWNVIRDNPKIIMGYSDTTTLLATLNMNSLVTFQGPGVMAGFSQINQYEHWRRHVKDMLFGVSGTYQYTPIDIYSEGYPGWSDPSLHGQVTEKRAATGWHWLQGKGAATGTLFGGCIEVLEVLKGTRHWPDPGFWDEKILFLETSEEKPPVSQIRWNLRNYGVQGVFGRISALLFGRAVHYTDAEKQALDEAIVDIVTGEFGRSALPIVTNMDFGHTDPQYIMPLGISAQLDCTAQTFCLLESAVSD